MPLLVKIDGVTLTAPAWLVKPAGDFSVGAAADGSGATGSIVIDDAAGTRRIRGWQKFEIDETDCTLANNGIADAPRLMTAYAGRRTYSRGPYRDGPGRYITVELFDTNVLLSTRLLTGGDTVRPEETDTARLAWLLGSDYLDGLVQDLGLVNGIGRTYDADNLHGFYPSQVLQDLAAPRDFLFFTYYDQVAAAVGLFYDQPNAATNEAALSISNDMADVNYATIWPPAPDGEMDADPAEVFSNLRFVYSGGVFYDERQATADEFFTDNDFLRRGTQIENPKVGKASTAEIFADRFLLAAKDEKLTLSCTVQLPGTHVNLLDAGMRVPVKFTHLPDYEFDDFTDVRVQSRQVTQAETLVRPDGSLVNLYDVRLSLALTGVASLGSGGGGGPGGTGPGGGAGGGTGSVPQQPPVPAVLDFCATTPAPSVAGNSGLAAPAWRGTVHGGVNHDVIININSFQVSGTPLLGSFVTAGVMISWDGGALEECFIKADLTGGIGADPNVALCWNDGALTSCAGTDGGVYPASAHPTGTLNPSSVGTADHVLEIWGIQDFSADYGGSTVCISIGDIQDSLTLAVIPNELVPAENNPQHGQWSAWFIPQRVGAAGDMGFPYATGSLEIKVDGVLINPSSYTEDPTAGTFTLGWTPDTDERVVARAQGI